MTKFPPAPTSFRLQCPAADHRSFALPKVHLGLLTLPCPTTRQKCPMAYRRFLISASLQTEPLSRRPAQAPDTGRTNKDGIWRTASNGDRDRVGIAPSVSLHLYVIERDRGDLVLVRDGPKLPLPMGGESSVTGSGSLIDGRPPVLAHQSAQSPVGRRLVFQSSARGPTPASSRTPPPADRRTADASSFPFRGDPQLLREDEHSRSPSGPGTNCTSTPSCTSSQSCSGQILLELPQHRLPRAHDVSRRARSRKNVRFSSNSTMPRSITQTRLAWPYFASIAATISSTVVDIVGGCRQRPRSPAECRRSLPRSPMQTCSRKQSGRPSRRKHDPLPP